MSKRKNPMKRSRSHAGNKQPLLLKRMAQIRAKIADLRATKNRPDRRPDRVAHGLNLPPEVVEFLAKLDERMATEWGGKWDSLKKRLDRRPDVVRDGLNLPPDVATFLWQLQGGHLTLEAVGLWDDLSELVGDITSPREGYAQAFILEILYSAYMTGCREGYIEGFVARREPDCKRSAVANASKRKVLVEVDGVRMTRDQRDENLAREFAELVKLMKPTPAKERLAEKYGFESWQGVSKAIERFTARASE